MSEPTLPPQPKPGDFEDKAGVFRESAYKAALDAWRAVCRDLIERQRQKDFWG